MLGSQISIALRGIAAVLESFPLAVPVHQRSFAWKKTEIQEFLEDLNEAFKRNEEHFLGTVVVISPKEDQPAQVIDGQQRLATTALLLAGIVEQLTEHGDEERALEIRRTYLAKYDIGRGETYSQLRLNQADEPYFRTLLNPQFQAPAPSAPESHQRLFDARNQSLAWLLSKVAATTDPISWLTNLFLYLSSSFSVILVEVPDDANAFLIFETLNDRGIDLTIADLLKNYLLGHASVDIDVVLAHWTNATAILNAYGGENLFSTFLRHLWSSQYAVVRERDLYRDIKARIVSRPNVVSFSDQLDQESSLYGAIISPEHEFWTSASAATQDALRTLDLLGLVQFRPTLLAALVHLPMPEVEKLLVLLVSWNVRLLIVGGLGGGVMESRYSEIGQDIRRGEVKTANDIANLAQAFVPNDSEFRSAFAEARVSTVRIARYYLRKLEQTKRGRRRVELVAQPDPNKLTLEHVLPEKPLQNWPQFTTEEAAAHSDGIGNLALLTQRLNNKLKSDPFESKRPIFASSELLLTQGVAEYGEWNTDAIKARQIALADLALRAWPMS